MKVHSAVSIVLTLLLIFLPSCSTYQARQAIQARDRELTLNDEAWQVARQRLHDMCPKPPSSTEEYRTQQLRAAMNGQTPFQGCDVRMVKLTNDPVFDDWQWDWLPSYQVIVSVHEEELRKRVTPKLYEEYMLGLSRYLAKKVDSREITPQQLMSAFNEGWKWMYNKMEEEKILLQNNVQSSQQADAAVWKTLNAIAVGLAAVATTAIIAYAAIRSSAPAYQPPPLPPIPQPVHCNAIYLGGGMTRINCF